MTTARVKEYFQEKKREKVIIAAGGYYVKNGKFKLHTSLTFAEQNRERRLHGHIREYKDVLQFPIDFGGAFQHMADERNIEIHDQAALIGMLPLPAEWLSSEPFASPPGMVFMLPGGDGQYLNDGKVLPIEYYIKKSQ